MSELDHLFPELSAWNHGRGISPVEWIFIFAKSDIATALNMLFWPRFEVFEGYVLREGFSVKTLRQWEASPNSTRKMVEGALNTLDLGDLFRSDDWTPVVEARSVYLVRSLADAHRLKLARDFPDRDFEVSVFDGSQDDGEISLSFWQV